MSGELWDEALANALQDLGKDGLLTSADYDHCAKRLAEHADSLAELAAYGHSDPVKHEHSREVSGLQVQIDALQKQVEAYQRQGYVLDYGIVTKVRVP